ncbi:YdiU family protein [Desulfitobacterium sp. THU1]|uniref:protein adenylyltransferase SelO n=1 Tax=Desulfitobacterium sp. THU1 TaxID=3138072 RepID=UPI00311F2CE9
MIDEQEIQKAGWNFDNTYASLPSLLYTKLSPVPVNSPEFVILNERLAESLGLNVQSLKSDEGISVFAGNRLPEGAEPLAQAYAGHQFGHFTMLGDGRALLLGEQMTPEGGRYDIQLKGSGKTPYSRGGDGRAALGPMLREYIISEAMFGLGIPTTRSLAVVTTGESIVRETMLPGAILTRIAASHIRVGTFQYVSQWGTVEDLRTLAEYTLERHYGHREAKNPYPTLLQEVIKRQASLIAQWQLVGFIHGVMNTDNMVVSGETIDYGPCAFMDTYDPATVFSSIDRQGRYAYRNQPYMAAWNLARFAETLLPLLSADEEEAIKIAEAEVSQFFELYQSNWLRGMRAKLGLLSEEAEDESFIKDLLDLMEKHQADYTNTFLALTFDNPGDSALFSSGEFVEWKERWQGRINRQQESRESSHQLMRNSNPAVIPRNHRVEAALEAAVEEGDYSVLRQLLQVLENPYAHTREQLEYSQPPEPSSCGYRTFCGT